MQTQSHLRKRWRRTLLGIYIEHLTHLQAEVALWSPLHRQQRAQMSSNGSSFLFAKKAALVSWQENLHERWLCTTFYDNRNSLEVRRTRPLIYCWQIRQTRSLNGAPIMCSQKNKAHNNVDKNRQWRTHRNGVSSSVLITGPTTSAEHFGWAGATQYFGCAKMRFKVAAFER